MYNLVTIKDTIRIPPNLFSSNIEESVLSALRHQYENRLDKKLGVVITVTNPKNISDGKIILGDGASYHDVEFDLVTFKPELHEVIHAKVTDLQEFGPFIRFGPIEGLVHVSQVTDDFMSMNQQTGALSGKESKKVLRSHRPARIWAVHPLRPNRRTRSRVSGNRRLHEHEPTNRRALRKGIQKGSQGRGRGIRARHCSVTKIQRERVKDQPENETSRTRKP